MNNIKNNINRTIIKITKALSLGVFLTIASISQAALLNLEPGTQVISGVNIAKGASLQVDNQVVALTGVGAGLRNYRVLAAKVKVYVGQMLLSEPQKFSKRSDEALNSLDGISTIAFRITFLRKIEAQKIQVAFRDSLVTNNIDLQSPEIDGFLQVLGKGEDVVNGSNMTIVFHKNTDGTESLLFENTNNSIVEIKGTRGFTQRIMSIWLGKAIDGEMEDFKNQLLK